MFCIYYPFRKHRPTPNALSREVRACARARVCVLVFIMYFARPLVKPPVGLRCVDDRALAACPGDRILNLHQCERIVGRERDLDFLGGGRGQSWGRPRAWETHTCQGRSWRPRLAPFFGVRLGLGAQGRLRTEPLSRLACADAFCRCCC